MVTWAVQATWPAFMLFFMTGEAIWALCALCPPSRSLICTYEIVLCMSVNRT